jgi:hypothetical protein
MWLSLLPGRMAYLTAALRFADVMKPILKDDILSFVTGKMMDIPSVGGKRISHTTQ